MPGKYSVLIKRPIVGLHIPLRVAAVAEINTHVKSHLQTLKRAVLKAQTFRAALFFYYLPSQMKGFFKNRSCFETIHLTKRQNSILFIYRFDNSHLFAESMTMINKS